MNDSKIIKFQILKVLIANILIAFVPQVQKNHPFGWDGHQQLMAIFQLVLLALIPTMIFSIAAVVAKCKFKYVFPRGLVFVVVMLGWVTLYFLGKCRLGEIC